MGDCTFCVPCASSLAPLKAESDSRPAVHRTTIWLDDMHLALSWSDACGPGEAESSEGCTPEMLRN